MRVSTLRTISITMLFILIDIPVMGFDLLPDSIGLAILFFCAVTLTDRAGRFARTAAVSAIMLFLEASRILKWAGDEAVVNFLGLLYMFLSVLLVITAADGIAQFAMTQGNPEAARFCDTTGHLYALTFVLSALSMWFSSLKTILDMLNLIISGFTIVMFVYFYAALIVTLQTKPDNADSGDNGDPADADTPNTLHNPVPMPVSEPDNS